MLPVQINGTNSMCIAFEPFDQNLGDQMHLALIFSSRINYGKSGSLWDLVKQLDLSKPMPVRIHSECLLGDALLSEDCDCQVQLKHSIRLFSEKNNGILLYLRQEGRGIGLRRKLSCLALQKGYIKGEKICHHYSADEANRFFGHKDDERDYSIVADFLNTLNIREVAVLTGNPEKIRCLNDNKLVVSKLSSQAIDVEMDNLSKKARLELEEKIRRGYRYNN